MCGNRGGVESLSRQSFQVVVNSDPVARWSFSSTYDFKSIAKKNYENVHMSSSAQKTLSWVQLDKHTSSVAATVVKVNCRIGY